MRIETSEKQNIETETMEDSVTVERAGKLYEDLLLVWCDALIVQQITEEKKETEGGIWCPACKMIHGRSGDAILPMMYLAKHTGEKKYLDCARKLFQWSDNMFHKEGYYVNDTNNGWTGITVFFNVQLGEALKNFGELLSDQEKQTWWERYYLTADYVYAYIDKIGATINYPMTAAYAMALAASLAVGEKAGQYRKRALELGKMSCDHISESGLLFGEGHPCDVITPKGARAIDIAYNLEESIPSLLEYCELMQEMETRESAMRALDTHTKFFLPDGGIDNSFGSRSYKWSCWGSRTSDGIQAMAALVREERPKVWKAAYRNAILMKQCTRNGLLEGGPMYGEAGELPCVHHTFCHVKSLAKALMILEMKQRKTNFSVVQTDKNVTNRENSYFSELCTFLVEHGDWRVTVTDYDYEYCAAAHGTGGSMTLLYHKGIGPVCVGTMNRYYIVEGNNMQKDAGKEYQCLTPRIEYIEDGICYRSSQDLTAECSCLECSEHTILDARGCLREEEQQGKETYSIHYDISAKEIRLEVQASRAASFYLPLIASEKDAVTITSAHELRIKKNGGELRVTVAGEINWAEISRRIFNPVGGFLAYPLEIKLQPEQKCEICLQRKLL